MLQKFNRFLEYQESSQRFNAPQWRRSVDSLKPESALSASSKSEFEVSQSKAIITLQNSVNMIVNASSNF